MPCYVTELGDGDKAFFCGNLGPYCADARCMDLGEYLCDFPISDGKTCDMPLCRSHAFEAAPNVHYCPGHAFMWREFRERGGVEQELKNVIPWKEGK